MSDLGDDWAGLTESQKEKRRIEIRKEHEEYERLKETKKNKLWKSIKRFFLGGVKQ